MSNFKEKSIGLQRVNNCIFSDMWGKLLLPPVLKKDEIITYEILFRV